MRAQAYPRRCGPRCILCYAPGQGATPELDGYVYGIPRLRLKPCHWPVMRGTYPIHLRSKGGKGIIMRIACVDRGTYRGLYAEEVLQDLVNPLLREDRVASRRVFHRRPFQLCPFPLQCVA